MAPTLYKVSVDEPGQRLGLKLGPHSEGCCVHSSTSDDPAKQALVGKLVSSIAGAGPAVELLAKSSDVVQECIKRTDPPFTLYFVDAAAPDRAGLTVEPPATPTMGCTVGGLELELETLPGPAESPRGTALVDRLRGWARLQPDKTLYIWLDSKGKERTSWSYRELEMRANAVCHALLHDWGCCQGDRAALMYMPGLEFIAAFWGCLFAGVVGVPVYPVDLRSKFELSVERFGLIMAACEPKVALSHSEYLNMKRLHAVKNILGSGSWPEGLEFEATDELTPTSGCGTDYPPGLEQLAFLQFTSGSTGDPKGVMLSHSNLADNCEQMRTAYGGDSSMIGVSWLPQYHDMGLIGQLLCPAYLGGSAAAMSPGTFISSPLLWLQAMSVYKGTHSSAPNFAYALCLRKISTEARGSLDLAHVVMLMNAAEPISKETLLKFCTGFASAGVQAYMLTPGYGLAEHTVFACCSHTHGVQLKYVVKRFDKARLNELEHAKPVSSDYSGSTMGLVSSGQPLSTTSICIAKELDNGQLVRQPDQYLGEICLSSPSKAQGYWGRPELSRDTFQATIADDPTGTEYLRTGDLGFIYADDLYVCGRLKDLIIINGKNYYPQDIERSAEASHDLLKPGCSAAFSVKTATRERLVVVAEVRGELDRRTRQAVLEALRAGVGYEQQLELGAVVLVKERTVPKTTSGKIKRRACSQGFQEWAGLLPADGDLGARLTDVAHWVAPTWELPQAGSPNVGGGCKCCVLA